MGGQLSRKFKVFQVDLFLCWIGLSWPDLWLIAIFFLVKTQIMIFLDQFWSLLFSGGCEIQATSVLFSRKVPSYIALGVRSWRDELADELFYSTLPEQSLNEDNWTKKFHLLVLKGRELLLVFFVDLLFELLNALFFNFIGWTIFGLLRYVYVEVQFFEFWGRGFRLMAFFSYFLLF